MPRPQVPALTERLDASSKYAGRGVCIGIIDIGFYPHPDLMFPRRRIVAYADATRDVPLASDFFTPQPFSWHGTMTAACAAGNGYLSGGRYRALASEASVVLIKAGVDGGRVVGKPLAHAIRLPLRYPHLGIRILSISMACPSTDPDKEDVEAAVREVTAKGITVFAAAGNTVGRVPSAPASATESIAVGGQHLSAPGETEREALWHSSYGSPRPGVHKPDLLAPAIWVPAPMLPGTLVAREAAPLFQLLSVLEEASAEYGFSEQRQTTTAEERASVAALLDAIGARMARSKYISQDYQHVDGTSFATPIVASVAAQMLEANPTLSPALLREGLTKTATLIAGVEREKQGAGLLRPRKAVEWAVQREGAVHPPSSDEKDEVRSAP